MPAGAGTARVDYPVGPNGRDIGGGEWDEHSTWGIIRVHKSTMCLEARVMSQEKSRIEYGQ